MGGGAGEKEGSDEEEGEEEAARTGAVSERGAWHTQTETGEE